MDLFEHLLSVLEEYKQRRVESLVSGSATDFATYKNMTGAMTGLTLAIDAIKDVRKSYTESDSDD